MNATEFWLEPSFRFLLTMWNVNLDIRIEGRTLVNRFLLTMWNVNPSKKSLSGNRD